MAKSSSFLELKRIEAARDIATVLSQSRNRVFLDADSLLLNLTAGYNTNLERRPPISQAEENQMKVQAAAAE